MYFRFGLSCLILLVCLSCTALARSNGPRHPVQRHHRRRAASLSEFLTPPAPPSLQRNRPPSFPPSSPVRHGKILSPLPSPTPQPPGFFSRFMGWINPFGGTSQPPQPNPQVNHPGFQSSARPHDTYGPPHSVQFETHAHHQQPKPPSPQTTNSQLPPLKEKNCNPCNSVPWIPMIQGIDVSNRYAENSPGINLGESHHQNLESLNDFHIPAPSHEVKIPDFGWQQPFQNPQQTSDNNRNPYNVDYPSPITGPIPNPHLYPGAMPPLFKAIAWDSAPAASGNIDQYRNSPSGAGLDAQVDNKEAQQAPQQEQYFENTGTPSSSSSSLQSSDYVDVLPPGAETVSGPEDYPPISQSEVHHNPLNANAPSSFDQPADHVAAASLNPVFDTLQHQKNSYPEEQVINNPSNVNQDNYDTRLSPDGQHVIHIEESPIIDLSVDDNDSKDSSASGVAEEAPAILQNPDGTYGINATWPTQLPQVTWSSNQESSAPSSTIKSIEANSNLPTHIPSIDQQELNRNITSLLVDVLRNSESTSRFGQRITTQQPYGTYQDVDIIDESRKFQTTSTTEEPFFEAVMKSYNNFLKEIEEEDNKQVRFDPRDIQPGAGFSISPPTGRRMKDEGGDQPQSGKKSKKVQIIIPYTSQYTPSPFHPPTGTPNNPGKLQPRKVPVALINDNSKETTEATEEELSHVLQTLESLPKLKTSGKPFSVIKANTSIDPLRLQKNIDNWTIQEYSRGTTVSTAVPNSFHHQLLQSKKIPDEYFTTTEPVTSAGTIKEAEKSFGNVLAGFNYNDLDHDVSASSRIEVPRVREKSESSSQSPTTESPSSSEDVSWEQLPVSISPLSKERVYIVTPQPVSKPSKFHVNSTNDKSEKPENSTLKFESIERAYQVLPEAVNNLAVASTGPATVPLWGIMDHEEYASVNSTTSTSPKSPIQYSGHSRVSHTGQ